MLHHGTVDIYVEPILNAIDVACGRRFTDFSHGFYTTTNYDQARAHARNMLHRLQQRGARRGAVLTYTVDRDAIAALRSLAFPSPRKWGEMIRRPYVFGGAARELD
jgi:Protein of unknown function (DUF3990)